MPCGTPDAGDVPPLADILAHFNSDEYLETLQQLAESLLSEIDGDNEGESANTQLHDTRQCPKGSQVVGTTPEQLESSRSAIVDAKHDVDRILSQHSYAHPYVEEKTPTIQVTSPQEKSSLEDDKINPDNGDKGDMFFGTFDEADCVTIVVPSEEQTATEEVQKNVLETDAADFDYEESSLCLDTNFPMLSPMSACTLSPLGKDFNLSPAHTSISDLGYESVTSPFSDHEKMDLSDFWCDNFSELFPGLE